MIKKIGMYLVIAGMVFAVPACSDDDNDMDPTPPDEQGTFTFSMSGDMEGSFEGFAVFGEMNDPETNEKIFFISLVADADGTSLGFLKLGEQPSASTYPIEGIDFEDIEDDLPFGKNYFIASINTTVEEQMYFFVSHQGSITFHESSANTLTGTFEFTAIGLYSADPENELTVSITGSFNAIHGETSPPIP